MNMFRKCLDIDPGMGKAAFSLSLMLMSGHGNPKSGALEEAIKVLETATRAGGGDGAAASGAAVKGPLADDREAHFNLAVACVRLLTESIAAVDKGDVDKGDSDGTEARVAEADAVESGKLADLAKRSFYKVLELEPVDASRRASGESADWLVHKVLGSIAINENDFDKATYHLKLACAAEASPLGENYEVQYNIGFAYLQMDSLELAFQHFKRAHGINPDREMARNAMEMLRDSKAGSKAGKGGAGTANDIAAAATVATAKVQTEQESGEKSAAADAVTADQTQSTLPPPLKPDQLAIMKQTKKKKKQKRVSTKKSSVDLSSDEVEQLKLKLKPSRGGPRHGRHRSSQEVIPWGNTASLANIWLRNAKRKSSGAD
jgi:hypothetical protein